MSYKAKYREWLISDYFDEETKAELESIEDDEVEIEDRFYKDLTFGTGGMRGKIGAGTNRINKYIVRKATQGFANYIINYLDEGRDRGVVISYDSRHKSREFARETALVLNGNGIKTYLFDELKPTPELSFAVRELNAIGGVMVTASHNPPEYNGYKVYGEDGCQAVPEKARKIIAEIDEIDDFNLIKRMNKETAKAEGFFNIIGEEIDKKYMEALKEVIPDKELAEEKGKELDMIYTPLHGTGNKPVRRLLDELGFENLEVVEEQTTADPDFSTVEQPNPEEDEAYEMALKQAAENDNKADLIFSTDPDCDRLGILAKHEGEYRSLNGNELGILLGDYLLNKLEKSNQLPEKGVIIKTIVTTEMIRKIAAEYNVEVIDVLTGFKFIGEKMTEFENDNRDFIFGFEESYGYLAGTYARDKDAVIASALAAVMTLYYKEQNKTLYDRLAELREKYGYYMEDLKAIKLEGKVGQEKINGAIESLRQDKAKELIGKKVIEFKDYLEQKSWNYEDGSEKEINLPESNVLQYILEDETLITVRPSGTEPKLKLYYAIRAEDKQKAETKLKKSVKEFTSKVKDIIENL
ncbi:MAG: phospho-sugar mutase [Bacillota bacterium]